MRKILTVAFLSVTLVGGVASADPVQNMWKAKCGNCHGADGKGKTKKGEEMGIADMTTAAWKKEWSEAKIKEATRKGLQREKDGKKQKMDGYDAGKIKDDQLDALAKFIAELK